MNSNWVAGNTVSLLENGDAFFKRILEVIDQAAQELLIETFILNDDPLGRRIHKALIEAAHRGVWISLLVDGFGSHDLPQTFINELKDAGIHFRVYDPQPKWFGLRVNIFKRMHRKIVVVDGLIAFIGGINMSYDHLSEYGANAKQDYAVELSGPVVSEIQQFTRHEIQACSECDIQFVQLKQMAPPSVPSAPTAGPAEVLFVIRDNDRRRTSIEAQYLARIRQAKHRITIANCYFFPGYKMLRALRNAARRGVKVCLLTQGKPDNVLAQKAAYMLYDFLIESNIAVFEYWERPLHGKIAAIDDDWATVGSSNMDPLSFCLNLEANVFVQNAEFNALIHARIQYLIEHSAVRPIDRSWLRRRTWLMGLLSFLVYHLLRYLPGLTAWLPRLERNQPTAPLTARPGQHDSDPGG